MWVNEFSAFLCMERCRRLGSLELFLWYTSQLSGASILLLSILNPLRVHSPGRLHWQVAWWPWHPLLTVTWHVTFLVHREELLSPSVSSDPPTAPTLPFFLTSGRSWYSKKPNYCVTVSWFPRRIEGHTPSAQIYPGTSGSEGTHISLASLNIGTQVTILSGPVMLRFNRWDLGGDLNGEEKLIWLMGGTNSVCCCCLYIWMNSRNWDAICLYCQPISVKGSPGGWDGKESACNVGHLGSIPGLGRSPGEGNGYPLQYSGLENSMDRGAWQAIAHGVAKSWTWLSN